MDRISKVGNFDRDTAKWSCIFTFTFMIIAHAYRFFSLGYSNDSVAIVQSVHRNWKIQLGRVLQPIYWEIRGSIVAPYLIGLLACVYLAAAVYLIVRILRMHSKLSIALIAMLLSTNVTMNQLVGTFVHELDTYMLAFLLSVLAVAIWENEYIPKVLSTVIGAGFVCISLGLYQSFFQVSIVLFLMVLCRRSLDEEAAGKVFADGVRALLILIAGLIAYDVALTIVEKMTGIGQGSYVGINEVKNLNYAQIPKLLLETYLYPFKYYLQPDSHNSKVTALLYISLLSAIVILEVILASMRRLPLVNCLFVGAFTFLMPLGMNAVYFVSKGIMYAPMMLSYFVIFAFGACLCECIVQEKVRKAVQYVAALMVGMIFFNNTVYAHHFYLRRELEFQSTLSLMTRVIDRVEQVEGYKPGSTPVAFAGSLYNSPLSMERPGFGYLMKDKMANANNYYATSSEEFYPYYFWQIMGYPFNMVGEYERYQISRKPEVRNMPVFPQEGCCRMIDGVMVVKVGALMKLD